MSDSNEPANGSGPDPQPELPAQAANEREAPTPPAEPDAAPPSVDPQDAPAPPAEEDTSPPPADGREAPIPADEQGAAPPSPDPRDTPAPPAEEDTSPPPADEREAPIPADEQDAPAPAAKEDTPAPPEDAQDTTDDQSDGASEVESAATQKLEKPAGGSKAPQAPDTGRSAGPRPPRRRPGKPPKGPSVVIRYGLMGHLGQFRHNLQPAPARGVNVVVRTDRGVELGEVVTVVSEETGLGCIAPRQLEEHIEANGPDYPFRRDGKVLRLANPQDLIDQRHLNSSARDERQFCAQEIKELKLDMKLVAAEHLLGGERIIFYFLAEHRIDFRELVHTLANQYHTRIEMRQVGARDEARLVGDYERCGQECCCKQFLKGLQPVSMRMAKTQKATLDPSKISGRCGRLMCCLRYEDQCYRDLKKCLPHKNIWVRTQDQIGRVTGAQILTQLVQVQLPDGSRAVFANEDIIERNVDPPEEPPAVAPKAPRQTARKGDRDRKQQDSAPSKRQAKRVEDKQITKPPRKTKPQPAPQAAPKPAPKPDPQPRASAEALDPGWAGLLGDNVVENDSPPTSQPPQDTQAPIIAPAAEDPQASPEPQATADPTPETPPSTPEPTQPQGHSGKKRKKRRRRRGRGSKRKQGN